MEFYLEVFESGSYANPKTGWLRESFRLEDNFSFGTSVEGGFGEARIPVPLSREKINVWLRKYLRARVVLRDERGRLIYEGRINDISLTLGDSLELICSGYWARAEELTHGIIYPAGSSASVSDVVRDACGIVGDYNTSKGSWSGNLAGIETTTTDISPQDFTGEVKVAEAIREVLKYGNDDVPPKKMYFVLWDDITPYLFSEPEVSERPDWNVELANLGVGKGFSITKSGANIYNKIQILYDDPDIGPTFTGWKEDLLSQIKHGEVEGSVNLGPSLPGVADVVGDLYIDRFTQPEHTFEFSITGSVRDRGGAKQPSYLVRAGDLLRVSDFDPSSISVGSLEEGGAGVFFVKSTGYSSSNGRMTIEVGRMNMALGIILAKIGKESASIS